MRNRLQAGHSGLFQFKYDFRSETSTIFYGYEVDEEEFALGSLL